jgi:hypothetical protein
MFLRSIIQGCGEARTASCWQNGELIAKFSADAVRVANDTLHDVRRILQSIVYKAKELR